MDMNRQMMTGIGSECIGGDPVRYDTDDGNKRPGGD